MILPFTLVQIGVAVVAGVLCLAFGLAKRPPNDPALYALAVVETLLLAQTVVAIVAPGVGNPPSGNPIEFWAYGVTILLVPPLAVVWALREKDRWATVVMGVAALAVAVMLWRMQLIWTVQGA